MDRRSWRGVPTLTVVAAISCAWSVRAAAEATIHVRIEVRSPGFHLQLQVEGASGAAAPGGQGTVASLATRTAGALEDAVPVFRFVADSGDPNLTIVLQDRPASTPWPAGELDVFVELKASGQPLGRTHPIRVLDGGQKPRSDYLSHPEWLTVALQDSVAQSWDDWAGVLGTVPVASHGSVRADGKSAAISLGSARVATLVANWRRPRAAFHFEPLAGPPLKVLSCWPLAGPRDLRVAGPVVSQGDIDKRECGQSTPLGVFTDITQARLFLYRWWP
jgi:hypothetical protein